MIEKIKINEKDNILIIAPHPDDECIGVGGILIQYPEQCTIIVCTDGRRATGDYSSNEIIQIRKKEFLDEMGYLGITRYRMLNMVDGTLMGNTTYLDFIDFSRYTKIFFPHNLDGHPDHSAVYMCVTEKLKIMGNINVELYMYEVHQQLQKVTHYIALDEMIDKKKKLIQFHKSQINQKKYDEMVCVAARYRALQLSLRESYVECYCQVDITDLNLATNYQLQQMEKNYQKQLEFYYILVNWIKSIQNGQSIGNYLNEKGLRKLAIYGYAELGQILDKELESAEELDVLYIMDKSKAKEGSGRILFPQRDLPFVDAVIVTAITYFDDIEKELTDLGYTQIFSLRDIVDEISSQMS